jgi:hypothetical protein
MLPSPLQLRSIAAGLSEADDELSAVRARVVAVLQADGWHGRAHDEFVAAGSSVAHRLDALGSRCGEGAAGAHLLAGAVASIVDGARHVESDVAGFVARLTGGIFDVLP